MGIKVTLTLTIQDRSKLQQIVARGENWRERERAQTILLLADGLSLAEAAEEIGIHVRTAGFTRLDWLARGFESLVDKSRSGAPRKISPEQLSKVIDAARSEPLTAKALLAKHVEEGGTLVHLSTLTSALKAAGFVWKRTRHSLKKKGMRLTSGKRRPKSNGSRSKLRLATWCWPTWMRLDLLRCIPIEVPGHPKRNATSLMPNEASA